MSKYLDNTGLSRLITKIKEIIGGTSSRTKTYSWTSKSDAAGMGGEYCLKAMFDFENGDSNPHLKLVTFTIVFRNGAGGQISTSFDISSCPYADIIFNNVTASSFTLATTGATSATNKGLGMYRCDISKPSTNMFKFTSGNYIGYPENSPISYFDISSLNQGLPVILYAD